MYDLDIPVKEELLKQVHFVPLFGGPITLRTRKHEYLKRDLVNKTSILFLSLVKLNIIGTILFCSSTYQTPLNLDIARSVHVLRTSFYLFLIILVINSFFLALATSKIKVNKDCQILMLFVTVQKIGFV